MATLSPGLSCSHLLNTWIPKTNLKCSSKCMLTSFLQRFTLSLGFLSLSPAWLQILHTHLLDPSLSFMPCKPLNPASLLPTPDPEAEHLSHNCVQTLNMTLNPFECITNQPLQFSSVQFSSAPYWPQSPILVHRWQCPDTSPIWGWIRYSPGTALQYYPPHLIKSATLPAHTSSQQTELKTLAQALTPSQRPKGKHLHDSKYVYITF